MTAEPKLNASGKYFNVFCTTEFQFKYADNDPLTGKPLARVTGVVDELGNELPPFYVACSVLRSMGMGAEHAMGIYESQKDRT